MFRLIRSRIGTQLLTSFSLVLLMSMGALIYQATREIDAFGKHSADSHEKEIRDHVAAFMTRITHEQAMRYEVVFNNVAGASAMLARQASTYLGRQALYAGTSFRPDTPLTRYPENGIFSNAPSGTVMALYWGAPEISGEVRQEIRALSHIDTILETVKEGIPESTACYVVTESGHARYYPNRHGVTALPPPSTFDIRNAVWYAGATPAANPDRETAWTNIYRDSVGQGLMTTAATPIYDGNGTYLGAAGIDITLDTIAGDILSELPSCHRLKQAFSFLIDSRGRLIAYPPRLIDRFGIQVDKTELKDASVVLRHTLLDSTDPEVRGIGKRMLEHPYQTSRFSLGDESYVFASHIMPSTGWRLGVAVPESSVLASVQDARKALDSTIDKVTGKLWLLASLSLLVAVVVIMFLSAAIFITPLYRLSRGALRVKHGDLSTRVDVPAGNEIGTLAQSFNDMVDTLQRAKALEKDHAKRLERQVEERTRALRIKNEERKKTLEDLRRSEEKYRELSRMLRLMCDNVPDMIWAKDLNKRFIFVNRAICDNLLHAADTDEPIGRTDMFFAERERNAHPDDPEWHTFGEICRDSDAVTMDAGVSGQFDEYGNVRGEFLFLSVHKAPFFDENGKMIGTVGSARDVTRIRVLEERLHQSQKLEAIGTLAGGIAHEFNNMLGIILGNTELAMEDVPEWSPAADSLKEVKNASLRAKEVVFKLLSVARKTPMTRKPIPIGPTIREALDLLCRSMPSTIDLRPRIHCNGETILADPAEITQVLVNLCDNALQAMSGGVGVLDVSLVPTRLTRDDPVRPDTPPPGDYVQLTVRDTGVGIPPEHMTRVFDPYFTTKAVDEGLGMGLAVVQGIVRKHDGTIRIQSAPARGTTVEVLFPLIGAEPETRDRGCSSHE